VKLREVGFVKRVLSREWNREQAMDVQSGESEKEEVMGEGIGESEMEDLVSILVSWYSSITGLVASHTDPHAGSIINHYPKCKSRTTLRC